MAQSSGEADGQAETRTMLAIVQPANVTPDLTALDARLRQMLASTGYRIVPAPQHVSPGQDIYFVTPEINNAGIEWIVADADGDPLGKVAQRRIANASSGSNENMILLGAAAAADGIHRIIKRQS
ncbi:MAG: hypothetical protein JKY32_01860 [Rhizobiales bacterium]|nr:hypothetical protein [Hyphomicrobiales bacterium]